MLWEHDQKNQSINFPQDKPNYELFKQNLTQAWQEKIEKGGSKEHGFFLVWEGDQIIGSLLLRIKENPYREKKYGEIWYIYLEPEYRGKGYGKRLLQFADDYFQKQGCAYAFAGISAHNSSSNIL
ncbi:GNAT family N-acetyltransferase, partial [Candidatus Woesearchaeota archaeon]|nr:GNAT family N-acetyltransferase [Candidatus Woesearchaeota archaeon]